VAREMSIVGPLVIAISRVAKGGWGLMVKV